MLWRGSHGGGVHVRLVDRIIRLELELNIERLRQPLCALLLGVVGDDFELSSHTVRFLVVELLGLSLIHI